MHSKTPTKKFNFKIDEIFLVLVVLIVAIVVISYEKSHNISPIEAEQITALLMGNHEFSIVSNGVVVEEKLDEIKNMDYVQLKEELNAKKDFCIYLEDGNGGIILAKSSEKLMKDGSVCKT